MGTDYNLVVDDEGVSQDGLTADKILFRDFRISSGGPRRTVDVLYGGSSNIAAGLPPQGYGPYLFTPMNHPMPEEKLAHYRIEPEYPDSQFHRWYIHNLSHFGRPAFMYFRNFAMMFNNLGLLRIDRQRVS